MTTPTPAAAPPPADTDGEIPAHRVEQPDSAPRPGAVPADEPASPQDAPDAPEAYSSGANSSAGVVAPELDTSPDPLEDFVLLPGLLRRWEIPQVVKAGSEFRIEEAGETTDHTPLFAVYRRESPPPSDAQIGVPVRLSFDDGQASVRARLLPISDEPLMAVLVLDDNPGDAAALAHVRDHLSRSARQAGETAGGREATARGPEEAP